MPKKPDSFREEFARFLEQPSRELFREVLQNHQGELPELEFKSLWPEYPKLAKHILAMANSGGGCLVAGVAEAQSKALEPTGLAALLDKADVDSGLRSILPQALMENLTVMDFSYEASEYPKLVGKHFQIVIVNDDPRNLPFMSLSETTGIRRTEVYVRRMASTVAATYEEVQTVLNRRIATGHSTQHSLDLNKHLDDLRKLYGHMEQYYRQHPMGSIASEMFQGKGFVAVEGAIVQKETFEQFISRMVVFKKREIEKLLCD
jgi:hypothetical protein